MKDKEIYRVDSNTLSFGVSGTYYMIESYHFELYSQQTN